MCVLFNVTADTVQKDGIMYAWLNIREASGKRGGTGTRRCGAERGHRNQALVQTLDLYANSHVRITLFMLTLLLSEMKKRERLHIQ